MAIQLSPGTFYGKTQGQLEFAGLTFAESVYGPELQVPKHAHVHAFFYLVLEGVCEEVQGRLRTIGGPSTLVFHPAGEPHANRWRSPGGRAFHVELSRWRSESLYGQATILDAPAEIRGGVTP